MIILEGADNSGKTTLSHELAKILKWPVIKNEEERYQFSQGNFRTVSEGFGRALLNLLWDTNENKNLEMIKDRDYPTELVYNRAYDRYPNYNVLDMMDSLHSTIDTRIVYCERRNYHNIGFNDDLVDISMINRIKAEYEWFFTYTDLEYIRIYLEDGTPQENAEKVVEWLKKV